jgi:3'-5' exoribonuclease
MLEIQHIRTGANFQVGAPQVLPQAWRLMTLRSIPVRTGVRVQAKLFHLALQRTVTWSCREVRPELKAGILVGIRSTSNITQTEEHGAVEIVRLVKLQRVEPEVNLFHTVPPQWVSDVQLLERASVLWQDLSPPMQAWFNALFWNEPARFKGFLQAPASMANHHAHVHGLFSHSLDCAERARLLAQWDASVNLDVLTMATLLHDVGKAQEYEWDSYKNSWTLSGRGALVGHKLSGLEWLAAARAFVPNGVHDSLAMSLYHALTACHAPEWVGLRSPRTPEAHYLASVDTLSGLCELTHRLADTDGGFGKYHKVFRGGPFTTAKPIDLAAQNQW